MDGEKTVLYDNPNRFAEKGRIILGQVSEIFGYQNFLLSESHIQANPDDKKLIQKQQILSELFSSKWFENKSVLDIGANSGFFSFYALLKGAKSSTALEIDKLYIDIMNQAKEKHNYKNLEIIEKNLLDYNQTADLVIAFALLHWIYSCTADYGSLDKAVLKLATLTKDILIVEWIEPDDEAIQFFKHTDYNSHVISEEYSFENFEEALKKYFYAFKMIGEVSSKRKVYLAVKNQNIIDLLKQQGNNFNLWEIFAELNEYNIEYAVLRNWELISENTDLYADMTIEILTNNHGKAVFNKYLSSFETKSGRYYSEYLIPMINTSEFTKNLTIKIILKDNNYISDHFSTVLLQSKTSYKNIYGLSAKALLLYVLYDTIYHIGAASNIYHYVIPILNEATGIRIGIETISDFSRNIKFLKYNGIEEIEYNERLNDYALPYLYDPEFVSHSRIIDDYEDKKYISRIYIIDNKIIKQTNDEIGEREYNFLKQFESEYFPKVYKLDKADAYNTIEEEFIDGYCLTDLSKFRMEFDNDKFYLFVEDCLKILDFLKSKKIIHRDISKENILVRNGKPVLIDFGWAVYENELYYTPKGLNLVNVMPSGIHNDSYAMGKILKELNNTYNLIDNLVDVMTNNDNDLRIEDTELLREILRKEQTTAKIKDKVSIIIPAYNNIEYTRKCIESIYDYTRYSSFEIIVIDNASTDGTLELLEDLSALNDNLHFIHNEDNLGFAKAINQGLEKNTNKFILFLNNDTIVTEGWLDNLLNEVIYDANIGIAGSLLLYPGTSLIQHCGVQAGNFQGKKMLYHKFRLRNIENVQSVRESHDADYLTAACMIVKNEVIDTIGNFDDDFINGFEDIDFCIRAKQAGFKIRYCGKSLVYHYESKTEGRDKFNDQNYKLLLNKWDDIIKPQEPEQQTVINLMDMWLREDLKNDPSNIDKIKELLKIARIRNSKNEIAEFETILNKSFVTGQVIIHTSIIIPVFNNLSFTKKCLSSIYENTNNGFEIIIINNNSTDETIEYLRELQKVKQNIVVINNSENLFYAKACNQGAKAAKGKYLVFLNNDTEVLNGWLDAGIKCLESTEEIGIAGAKLLYPDKTIQHCGIEFQRTPNTYSLWPQHRFRFANESDERVNKCEEVTAVTGACLFIKKELFDFVGGYCEEYELYFEDTDLCFKVRKAGKKIMYDPAIIAIHHEGKTLNDQNKINEYNLKSALIFNKKWGKEVREIILDTFIEKKDGKFYYLKKDFIPDFQNKQMIEQFAAFILGFPNYYLHIGGVGDALLLLSSFYDDYPEQIIFSLASNEKTMNNLFMEFPKLKEIYFIPWENNYHIQLYFRSLLPRLNNFKGMGVTPYNLDNEKEWTANLNIFTKYKVKSKPDWANRFKKDKIFNNQIVLAPSGSLKGMPDWKKNHIKPEFWNGIIDYLTENKITPIIIGTFEEADLYPLNDKCLDKRGYSFKEQMELLASADMCIAADSWHKTFSALSGVKTIVFQSVRTLGAEYVQDSSEFVFIYPWKEITLVKNIEEFKEAFDNLNSTSNDILNKKDPITSFSERFWKTDYNNLKTVLYKIPDAIGDALNLTALIHDVKLQFPHLFISVSGNEITGEIFKHHPDIEGFFLKGTDEEFAVDSISDKVFDYNDLIGRLPDYLNNINFMDILGNIAGIKFNNRGIVYSSSEEEINWANKEISGYSIDKKLIGVHLVSIKDMKRCYPYRNELIGLLLNTGSYSLINFGLEKTGINDKNFYDCGDEISIRKQIALASKCDAFLTIDSAFFHIGYNYLRKPTMVITGPTNPDLIGVSGYKYKAIKNNNINCNHCYWGINCKIECMNGLYPREIMNSFEEYLKVELNIDGFIND